MSDEIDCVKMSRIAASSVPFWGLAVAVICASDLEKCSYKHGHKQGKGACNSLPSRWDPREQEFWEHEEVCEGIKPSNTEERNMEKLESE